MSRSLEEELNVPDDATLDPSSTHKTWRLETSGGASISISNKSSLRADTSTTHPRCLLVGRQAATADIRIQHGSISRRHAVLYFRETQQTNRTMLLLQELGAKHGVHVNGTRIRGTVTLHPGDQIVFGNLRDTVFTVCAESKTCASDTAMDTATATEQEGFIQQEPNSGTVQTAEPGAGLTGRAKREAEIAAMMASLDETPIYTRHEPEPEPEPETSMATASGPGENEPSSVQLSVAKKYSLPVTERMDLSLPSSQDRDRRKVLMCLAADTAGSRFAVGGSDTYLKLYDFAGMDQHRTGPFKTLQVEEGHVVVALCYSNTGDRILVATGSVQPKVLDRDGNEIIQFVRGDMYVSDPARTSGHTAHVTGVAWHPLERDIVLTSSLDGSARIWNLNGKTQFQKLVCDKVYRAKGARGQKVGVTSVAFHPGGRELAFGTACGSIQIWNASRVGARPERVVYHAHGEGRPVHSLEYNVDGAHLASRSMDDETVNVWEARRLARSAKPVLVCTGLPSVHETSNCAFSHDSRLICAGTSEFWKGSDGQRLESGALKFFVLPTGSSSSQSVVSSAILEIPISQHAGVVQLQWHPKLNQLLVGCSDGSVAIFFDRKQSTKGAILISSRTGRPVDELSQLLASRAPKGYNAVVSGEIITPNALPMFRGEAKRKREKERADPVKSRKPEPPATGMKTGSQAGAAVNFTQFVSESIVKTKNIAGKDPREELFQYSEGKNYVSQAYEGNKILADKTVEEEEEEMKKSK